jgi:hypothetical protein
MTARRKKPLRKTSTQSHESQVRYCRRVPSEDPACQEVGEGSGTYGKFTSLPPRVFGISNLLLDSESPTFNQYLDAFLALDADSCVWAGRLPDDQPRFVCRVFDDESAITFPSSPFYGKDERSKAYQYDRFCGPCSGVEIGRVGDQYISELLEGRLGFTHDQALFWCDPGRHKGQPYIALILGESFPLETTCFLSIDALSTARLFPYYESPAELFEQWYCNTERYVQQTDPSEKQYPWDDYSYYDKDQHEGSVVENAVDKLDVSAPWRYSLWLVCCFDYVPNLGSSTTDTTRRMPSSMNC